MNLIYDNKELKLAVLIQRRIQPLQFKQLRDMLSRANAVNTSTSVDGYYKKLQNNEMKTDNKKQSCHSLSQTLLLANNASVTKPSVSCVSPTSSIPLPPPPPPVPNFASCTSQVHWMRKDLQVL